MFPLTLGLLTAVAAAAQPPPAAPKEARLYELRVYYAEDGKLDALNARFRDHTTRLFAKHGMTNVGYWVPLANKQNKLVYVLSYPDQAARTRAWDAFVIDPEWQAAKKASEAGGRLVLKVDSVFLSPTDYSPVVTAAAGGGGDRVFELRTYTATPGNAEALHDRFRGHTTKLFEKHGMTNLWYWTPVAGPKQKGTPEASLVYLLAHESKEARDASFAAFRADPAWQEVLKASEAKAGGSLTAKEHGVVFELMKATDYSPIK